MPTVPCNYIPGFNGDGTRDYLMVGASNFNVATVVAKLKLGKDRPIGDIQNMVLAHSTGAFFPDGSPYYVKDVDPTAGGKVVVTPTDDPQVWFVEWPMTGDTYYSSSILKYLVLIETLADGSTANHELSNLTFRTVFAAEYLASYRFLTKLSWLNGTIANYPLTQTLLFAFFNEGKIDPAEVLSDGHPGSFSGGALEEFYPSTPGLTHNVGVVWRYPGPGQPPYYDGGMTGQVRRWEIDDAGDPRDYVYKAAHTPEFIQLITDVLKDSANQQQAKTAVNGPAVSKFTWRLPYDFKFNDGDFYYAIKNCGVTMSVTATLANDVDGTIVSLVLSGYLEDLYDFDYGATTPAPDAAVVQTGYGTLGGAGAVFYLQMNFDGVDMAGSSAWPFFQKKMSDFR